MPGLFMLLRLLLLVQEKNKLENEIAGLRDRLRRAEEECEQVLLASGGMVALVVLGGVRAVVA